MLGFALLRLDNGMAPVIAGEHAVRQHVELVLLLVELVEADPEENAAEGRQNGRDGIVPDEKRVLSQRDESLVERGAECRREQEDGRDERAHVVWRLGKGVLQASDGREDFRETNEHVRQCLYPHVDRRLDLFAIFVLARVHLVAALAQLVDVVLRGGGREHCEHGHEEADRDTLERREVDADFAEGRVQKVVDKRNEDDQGQRVQIVDDVVGRAVQLHGGSLRGQVVRHLVVRQPVQRVEGEDLAGLEATADLVNPRIVEGHPYGLGVSEVAGFDALPEVAVLEVCNGPDRVQRKAALGTQAHESEGLGNDRTSGRRSPILVLAPEQDHRAEQEHDCGEGE